MARERKQPEKPSTAWQGTYGDMITLMLCFFVMLYNPSDVDVTQLATITQTLQMNETESVSGEEFDTTWKVYSFVETLLQIEFI